MTRLAEQPTRTPRLTAKGPDDRLSDRQVAILLFIAKFHGTFGYPPSIREIMRNVGLSSPASVHEQLSVLRDAGHISFRQGQNRTVRLVLPEGVNAE